MHRPLLHVLPLLAMLLPDHAPAQGPGYTDTPKLPGSEFRVHDAARPRPLAVAPPALAASPPPADAIVLFDGVDLAAWTGNGGKAQWQVEGGVMTVNGTGNIETRQQFGDCQLHIEFATPAEVKGDSQDRGNSGVFFFGLYEVQILDSHDNATYADGQCAALYGQFPPLVNACRKPGEWQAYDIAFTAPRFSADGKLLAPARVTVIHNGLVVQCNQELLGRTEHRKLPRYEAHGPRGLIKLQDHGNPMRFRNIWVRELSAPAANAAGDAGKAK